jgi:hypothetical protein
MLTYRPRREAVSEGGGVGKPRYIIYRLLHEGPKCCKIFSPGDDNHLIYEKAYKIVLAITTLRRKKTMN